MKAILLGKTFASDFFVIYWNDATAFISEKLHIFDLCCFYLSRGSNETLVFFSSSLPCFAEIWSCLPQMSGDHTFREVGVLFGGSWWLEMHDDMKVLYSPISCLHVFSFHFHLLVLKFLCLQFANAGRYSQLKWHCHLAESRFFCIPSFLPFNMSVASVESEWDMFSMVVENAENTVASFVQEDHDGGGSSDLQDLWK